MSQTEEGKNNFPKKTLCRKSATDNDFFQKRY